MAQTARIALLRPARSLFPAAMPKPQKALPFAPRRFTLGQAMEELASKKCVPCESKDICPMSEHSAQALLPKLEGWTIANVDGTLKLHKSWKVKSFIRGLDFFRLVADVAEAEGHHPDLHLVGWNNVKIEIWTHSARGLTENDFILAAKIDLLDLEDLLRRKAPKQSL